MHEGPGHEKLQPGHRDPQGADVFARAFSGAPTGVALARPDGSVASVNRAFCEMLGAGERELEGEPVTALFADGRAELVDRSLQALVDGEEARVGLEIELRASGGSAAHVAVAMSVTRDASGAVEFVVVHMHDVSEHSNAARAVRDSDRRFNLAFESAPIGMALVTLDGQLMLVNHAFRDMTGHDDDELLFNEPGHLAVPADAERCKEALTRALSGAGDTYRREERWLNARGHQLWVAVSSALIRDESGRPLYFIWHVEDVSDRRIAIDRLKHLADHDPLTGLANRRRFEQELEQQVARTQRYGERATLLVIDLDDFKSINDTYGHEAGDGVLRAVAETIRGRVRDSDIVSRIGGDEFAVLLLHTSEDRALGMAQSIDAALRGIRASAGDSTVPVTGSVGVASIRPGGPDSRELMALADDRMFRDKRSPGEQSPDDAEHYLDAG